MDDPNHEWDQLFASRGGFESAYEKLIAYARSQLACYQSDFGGGLALRQLDAEEIVNSAFDRLLSADHLPDDDIYLVLRRHIQNGIRSLAKSAGEKRLARVAGRPDSEAAYKQAEDLFAESPRENAEISDRAAYCRMVFMRVLSEEKDDRILCELTKALLDGWRDPNDMCELLEISRQEYDAAFGRLRRRFRKVVHRDNLEERE